jgi:hypothetical protein
LVVQIIKRNKKILKEIAEKIKMAEQDGQTRIFHSSVNFYANQLKLGIWKKKS